MVKSKKTALGSSLLQGLEEAALHSKGQLPLKSSVREVPAPPPSYKKLKIKRIRAGMNYTQSEFAAALNVKTTTIRSWEQGLRTPSEASNRLLQIFEVFGPQIIQRLRKVG
jgi:DNA-binding transcriptional regulator YiaG